MQTTKTFLQLFVNKATKLKARGWVQQVLSKEKLGFNVSFDDGKAIIKSTWPNDEEAFDAFILIFRFFVQNNDLSIQNLHRITEDPVCSEPFRKEVARVRDELNQYLDSTIMFKIEYNNPGQNSITIQPTYREIYETFLYGGIAHNVKSKIELLEIWGRHATSFAMLYDTFLSTIVSILETVSYLANLCDAELRRMHSGVDLRETFCKMSKAKSTRPIIAVTMGDPAGVGPELCLQLLAARGKRKDAVPLFVGSHDILTRVAQKLKKKFKLKRLDKIPETLNEPAIYDPPDVLNASAVMPGEHQGICGAAAARYIEIAARACHMGPLKALVTAPISKKALDMAVVNYPGHTEMLADLTGAKNVAMLLYSEKIACAFVTCHQSLKSVPNSLDPDHISDVARLAWQTVGMLRDKPPRLALLGLNPHAGEQGLFGDEEERYIRPAKGALALEGIAVDGPLAPDTAFTKPMLKRIGCYICMYHDQGGIPFKMLSFDTGVNLTMGLPIVRTSPDHGTAFDIAWQGKVKPDSFLAAYDLAVKLARR